MLIEIEGHWIDPATITAIRPVEENGIHPPRVVVDHGGRYTVIIPCESHQDAMNAAARIASAVNAEITRQERDRS